MTGRYRPFAPLIAGLILQAACTASEDGQEIEVPSAFDVTQAPPASVAEVSPGQPAIQRDQPCAGGDCTIVFNRVVTLSDSASPGMFGGVIFVDRDAAGNFLTTNISFDHFLIFDSTGRLLDVTGGRGQGPDEYRRGYVPTRGPFDSLYIADMVNARLSVLSPDRRYIRSVPFPYVPDLILADGTFIIAATLAAPSAAGYPVHHVAKDGTVLRSFGVDDPEYRADMRQLFTRVVGPGDGATVWMTPPGRYRLEEWDVASGRLLRTVTRAAPDWFTESLTAVGSAALVRPDPVVNRLWEDEGGLLWVFATVPDPDWKPLFSGESPSRGLTHDERSSIYDWMIEVLDPETGALVASQQFDEEMWIRYPYQYFVRPAGVRGDGVFFDLLTPRLSVKRRD